MQEARTDGVLAAQAAGAEGGDLGPSPLAGKRRTALHVLRGEDDDDRGDGGAALEDADGVREQRPVAEAGEDLVAAEAAAGAGGDDQRGGAPGSQAPCSPRGWAKIIRPAAVWSTRETTSRTMGSDLFRS